MLRRKNAASRMTMEGNVEASPDCRSPDQSLVIVIEDDHDVRDSLGNLLRSVDQNVVLFSSIAEFTTAALPDVPCCMILDVRLPGGSGFELQAQLEREGRRIPIIFVTGHGDIAMSVRAMKAGAVDFMTKPFRDQDMLDVVAQAIESDRHRRKVDDNVVVTKQLYAKLTPRERELMAFVTRGLLNKQIAAKMDLQEITVKIHRGNMMRKMMTKSVADLVRMAEAIGLHRDLDRHAGS
jgi:FixJ family two-component response regulator